MNPAPEASARAERPRSTEPAITIHPLPGLSGWCHEIVQQAQTELGLPLRQVDLTFLIKHLSEGESAAHIDAATGKLTVYIDNSSLHWYLHLAFPADREYLRQVATTLSQLKSTIDELTSDALAEINSRRLGEHLEYLAELENYTAETLTAEITGQFTFLFLDVTQVLMDVIEALATNPEKQHSSPEIMAVLADVEQHLATFAELRLEPLNQLRRTLLTYMISTSPYSPYTDSADMVATYPIDVKECIAHEFVHRYLWQYRQDHYSFDSDILSQFHIIEEDPVKMALLRQFFETNHQFEDILGDKPLEWYFTLQAWQQVYLMAMAEHFPPHLQKEFMAYSYSSGMEETLLAIWRILDLGLDHQDAAHILHHYLTKHQIFFPTLPVFMQLYAEMEQHFRQDYGTMAEFLPTFIEKYLSDEAVNKAITPLLP